MTLQSKCNQDDYAESLRLLSEKEKASLFWKNYDFVIRRLLPAEVADFIQPIDHSTIPLNNIFTVTLQLPGCLVIQVALRVDDDGTPHFRDNQPYLVPGIIMTDWGEEIIWSYEPYARYQATYSGSLALAAAMAEERFLSMDHDRPIDKPELLYVPEESERIDIIEDNFDD